MRLGIDIGNTLINFAIMDDEGIIRTHKLATHPFMTEDGYRSALTAFLNESDLEPSFIASAIVSCVVAPLLAPFKRLCATLFPSRALFLGPRLHSGIALKVDNPGEVGSDLVAVALGAHLRYEGDLFVADLGTASKYILLEEGGIFAGLAIAPGLRVKAEALAAKASALPEISMIAPASPIGKNTVDCMNSGAIYGSVYELEGFAKAFEERAKKPLKRILTGGNAPYLAPFLSDFVYDEHLLFHGLNAIAKRNGR